MLHTQLFSSKCFGCDRKDNGAIVPNYSNIFLCGILVGRFIEAQLVPNVDADDVFGDPTRRASFTGPSVTEK
jgi:hypothetical protein